MSDPSDNRPSETVLRARVTSRLAHSTLASLGALVSTCVASMLLNGLAAGSAVASSVALAVCFASWIALFVALAWPTTVTLGADGALVEWLGTKRWVRWSDVTEVRKPQWSFAVELVTRDGRRVTIPSKKAFGVNMFDIDVTQALIQRISQETSRVVSRGGAVEQLARGEGHSVEAWVASLRAVGQGAVGHLRQSAVSRESLRGAMEDTTLSESLRAAAAVALASLGAQDDVRVRVASIASPKLRAVMDAAAGEDDARLIDAMRAVDADEKKR